MPESDIISTQYERFEDRLRSGLAALAELLARPGFGEGPMSIGAELELFLIDERGLPFGINQEVHADTDDPRVTFELGRFNLEVNSRPSPLAGRPFTFLGRDIRDALAKIEAAAAGHGGRVAVIGILPTLRWQDLDRAALSDLPRYHAIREALLLMRPPSFNISIDGAEPLVLSGENVTLEAANTAFHIHLRIDPGDYVRTYNAVQMAVAATLAAAGNSPALLGHSLWEETRVPVLSQWSRTRARASSEGPWIDRVSFGHDWLRGSALELFQESVVRHLPLIPRIGPAEDPLACARAGGLPSLAELRLHHGTVWRWNRAVYDPALGGHLRIEMRVLPAGPSLIDMQANAAFLIGLSLGLAVDAERLIEILPFQQARHNFYCAAREGLDAELVWPRDSAPRSVKAADLLPSLLPLARQGLDAAGVEANEADGLIAVFEERIASGRTGASWQRQVLAEFEKELPRAEALSAMLGRYRELASTDLPVHQWPISV